MKNFLLAAVTNSSVYSKGLGGATGTAASAYGGSANLPSADVLTLIGMLIKSVLGLLGVVFLILIIYAGILWMTAAGNEDRVKKAQSILRNSVFGVAIVILAYFISYFVVTKLTGQY